MKSTDSSGHEIATVAETAPYPIAQLRSGTDATDWERGILLSRLHELEQENRELRRANETLRRAAACFNRPHSQFEG